MTTERCNSVALIKLASSIAMNAALLPMMTQIRCCRCSLVMQLKRGYMPAVPAWMLCCCPSNRLNNQIVDSLRNRARVTSCGPAGNTRSSNIATAMKSNILIVTREKYPVSTQCMIRANRSVLVSL